jgi:hypothetical protein
MKERSVPAPATPASVGVDSGMTEQLKGMVARSLAVMVRQYRCEIAN